MHTECLGLVCLRRECGKRIPELNVPCLVPIAAAHARHVFRASLRQALSAGLPARSRRAFIPPSVAVHPADFDASLDRVRNLGEAETPLLPSHRLW